MTTAAPSAANRLAISAPRPDVEPVTIATAPSSRPMEPERNAGRASDAIEREHLDRVAAEHLVDDVVGQPGDHLLGVRLAVRPGRVGVRVVGLEADVVLADRLE